MSIKFGSLEVADIKFGSIDVNYVYSGSNLVWQRSASEWEFTLFQLQPSTGIQSIKYDSENNLIKTSVSYLYEYPFEPIYLAHNLITDKYYFTIAPTAEGAVFWQGTNNTAPVEGADAVQMTKVSGTLTSTSSDVILTRDSDNYYLRYRATTISWNNSQPTSAYIPKWRTLNLVNCTVSSNIANVVLKIEYLNDVSSVKANIGDTIEFKIAPASGYVWDTVPTTMKINGADVQLTQTGTTYYAEVEVSGPITAEFDTGTVVQS